MSDERSDKSAFGEDRDAGAPFVIGSAELGVDLSALRNVKRLGVTELEEADADKACCDSSEEAT